jgi:uncharacterized protein YaaN involved in tellurite resistance
MEKYTSASNEIVKCSETSVIDTAKLRGMSLKELENYGVSIQDSIGEKSSEILRKAHMSDLGTTQESLDELQDIVTKQRKLLPTSVSPLRAIRRFAGKYEKVERRIEQINEAIEAQRNKLDEYVTYMMEQNENMGRAVISLKECEDNLIVYIEELQRENNTDQIRLQAAANRLKLITGTRVNAEQAQIEGLMIIKANQESKYQLEQVTRNVMPILKMQAVNAVGIKANKESIEIADKTRKITGELIERNAADVKNMVDKLQANRTSSVVDEEKLAKAQQILIEALESVAKASEKEAETNLKVARNLRETSMSNSDFIKSLTL